MNELWEPPEMLLGELYASSLKTVGLCLVYAPLWPWAYPLTTIALLFNYGCTKVGVAYWYKKPPMVSEELMTKFRSRLGLLMLLHTLVAFLAADAADPAVEAGLFAVGRAPSVPVVAMFFAWVVYELLDLPDVLSLIPGLGPKDELSRSGTEDTKGIPYRAVDGKGGVKEVQQYDVDEYICPSVTKYTPEFLLQHHFRDFGEAEDEADRNYAHAPHPTAGHPTAGHPTARAPPPSAGHPTAGHPTAGHPTAGPRAHGTSTSGVSTGSVAVELSEIRTRGIPEPEASPRLPEPSPRLYPTLSAMEEAPAAEPSVATKGGKGANGGVPVMKSGPPVMQVGVPVMKR